jgi:hypothetical protein
MNVRSSTANQLFSLLDSKMNDNVQKAKFNATVAVKVQQQQVKDELLSDIAPPMAPLLDIRV